MDLPGVGVSIAQDLRDLGIQKPIDLVGKDPNALYEQWQENSGIPERCMLYVFRCVVYVMNTPSQELEPDLMKWWKWKDRCLKK